MLMKFNFVEIAVIAAVIALVGMHYIGVDLAITGYYIDEQSTDYEAKILSMPIDAFCYEYSGMLYSSAGRHMYSANLEPYWFYPSSNILTPAVGWVPPYAELIYGACIFDQNGHPHIAVPLVQNVQNDAGVWVQEPYEPVFYVGDMEIKINTTCEQCWKKEDVK